MMVLFPLTPTLSLRERGQIIEVISNASFIKLCTDFISAKKKPSPEGEGWVRGNKILKHFHIPPIYQELN
jgi:hypothetical protein